MSCQFQEVISVKHLSIIGLTALLVSAPLTFNRSGLGIPTVGQVLAQNVQNKPQVKLNLMAAKQIVQQDQQGKQQITWQALQSPDGKPVVVQPGDLLRYTVAGVNQGDRAANNLVVTQPIPQKTVYVLDSSTVKNAGVTTTYSIDNGKSFVAKPTIQVKLPDGKLETRPAPASAYTHVRWRFGQAIDPKATITAAYQVRVK